MRAAVPPLSPILETGGPGGKRLLDFPMKSIRFATLLSREIQAGICNSVEIAISVILGAMLKLDCIYDVMLQQ